MDINEEELDNILKDYVNTSNENPESENEGSTCSVFSSEEEELKINEDNNEDNNDYLNNPIQIKHEKTVTGLHVLLVMFCFCFGTFMFISFLPESLFQNKFLENYFKTKCCSIIYNETRCKVEYYCKNIFDSWVKKNNLTDKLLDNCCYWLSPYSKNITTLYCNPYCIN